MTCIQMPVMSVTAEKPLFERNIYDVIKLPMASVLIHAIFASAPSVAGKEFFFKILLQRMNKSVTYTLRFSDLLRRHLSRHEIANVPNARSAKACNACHVSKSKCSGAPKCSLCIKRGITCSFDGTKEVVVSTEAAAVPPYGAPHSPALTTTSPGEISSADSPKGIQNASSIHTSFLRSLCIKPTSPNTRPRDDFRLDTAQEYDVGGPFSSQYGISILHQSVKSQKIFCLNQISNAPMKFRTWVSDCCKVYFDQFHLYWPVLHRAPFDEQQDPLIISSTVVLIGAWLNKPEGAKPLIFETHKLLVDQLFEQMV